MASGSVRNPTSVQIATTAVTGVLSISWNESRAPITGAADAETYNTIAEYGTASVSGSVTFRDPAQAASFANKCGSLSATFAYMDGSCTPGTKTLTITGVSTDGSGNSANRDSISNSTVNFIAVSSTGTASPISIA